MPRSSSRPVRFDPDETAIAGGLRIDKRSGAGQRVHRSRRVGGQLNAKVEWHRLADELLRGDVEARREKRPSPSKDDRISANDHRTRRVGDDFTRIARVRAGHHCDTVDRTVPAAAQDREQHRLVRQQRRSVMSLVAFCEHGHGSAARPGTGSSMEPTVESSGHESIVRQPEEVAESTFTTLRRSGPPVDRNFLDSSALAKREPLAVWREDRVDRVVRACDLDRLRGVERVNEHRASRPFRTPT